MKIKNLKTNEKPVKESAKNNKLPIQPKNLQLALNSNIEQTQNTNQKITNHNETNGNQALTEGDKGTNKKFVKKHTWIYDELFIKKNIVDMSFGSEEEKEEEPVKNQLLLNKYNMLMNDIEELKREEKFLKQIIQNAGKENKELAFQIDRDITSYKELIEQCLRMSAELTKEILNLKKQIREVTVNYN